MGLERFPVTQPPPQLAQRHSDKCPFLSWPLSRFCFQTIQKKRSRSGALPSASGADRATCAAEEHHWLRRTAGALLDGDRRGGAGAEQGRREKRESGREGEGERESLCCASASSEDKPAEQVASYCIWIKIPFSVIKTKIHRAHPSSAGNLKLILICKSRMSWTGPVLIPLMPPSFRSKVLNPSLLNQFEPQARWKLVLWAIWTELDQTGSELFRQRGLRGAERLTGSQSPMVNYARNIDEEDSDFTPN